MLILLVVRRWPQHAPAIAACLLALTWIGCTLPAIQPAADTGEVTPCDDPSPHPFAGDLRVDEETDLSCITAVEGDLILDRAPSAASLWRLRAVDGDLHIITNTELRDLGGLEALQTVGGALTISHNPQLIDTSALSNLETTGGLQLSDNAALGTLRGLSQLRAVDGALSITNNPALADLAGLDGLQTVDGDLSILDQPCLPPEAATALLAQLEPVGGAVVLGRNQGPCSP